jgi:HemY protein
MRVFLWLLTLFASAIGLAVLARFNPGNVVFFYPPYRVDLSLNFFIALLTLFIVVLFAIILTARATLNMPGRVSQYRAARQQRESSRALYEALKAFIEGRFGHAEKSANRAALLPENAGLAALIGARAAHRLQQPARRDAWLLQAQEDHQLRTARLMTSIELLAEDNKDSEAALQALSELNAGGIRHIHALRLALRVNQNARNWQEVLRLVRLLDKRKALHPALSRRLRDLSFETLLPAAGHDVESLKSLWASVPAEDRTSPAVAVSAANAFMGLGLQQDAAAILEKALLVQWDARLLRAYRLCAAPESSATLLAQIEHGENWLRERPNDAELSLVLGTLCLKQKLWGKAQRYLKQSLSDASERSTLQEAHLRLAQCHEELNEPEEAAAHYRQCAMTTLPALNKR